MTPTAAPVAPAPEPVDGTADPRQLAADLERAVLPLPPAERRAILARLVALAADPPANGHPPPPAELPPDDTARAAAELRTFGERFPPPDPGAFLADCRWLQEHWGTPTLEPYRGTHIAILGGQIVGQGDGSLGWELDLARALNVHPQRLLIEYVSRPEDPY
jgi:hypothetical protein